MKMITPDIGDTVAITNPYMAYKQGVLVKFGLLRLGWYVLLDGESEPIYVPFFRRLMDWACIRKHRNNLYDGMEIRTKWKSS